VTKNAQLKRKCARNATKSEAAGISKINNRLHSYRAQPQYGTIRIVAFFVSTKDLLMKFIDEEALLHFASTSSKQEARRATAILLDMKEVPRSKIARDLCCSYESVWRWSRQYVKHGIDGLKTTQRKGSGRTNHFTNEQRRSICELVKEGATSYKESHWSLKRITRHVIQAGIVDKISANSVRLFLLEEGIDWRKY